MASREEVVETLRRLCCITGARSVPGNISFIVRVERTGAALRISLNKTPYKYPRFFQCPYPPRVEVNGEIIIIMMAESNVSIRDFFQNVNLAPCTNEIAINSLDSFSPVWAILIQQMLPGSWIKFLKLVRAFCL